MLWSGIGDDGGGIYLRVCMEFGSGGSYFLFSRVGCGIVVGILSRG